MEARPWQGAGAKQIGADERDHRRAPQRKRKRCSNLPATALPPSRAC
jgi:hypothetical protein